MGMMSRGLPMPFVGRIAFLASASPGSTHAIITISMANEALSFAREADNRYRANYAVSLLVRRGPQIIVQTNDSEEVLVSAFRETTRADETLIYQSIVDIPPGEYDLVATVRDERSQRSGQEQLIIRVPRLVEGTVAAPVPIIEVVPRSRRDAIPSLLVSARATVIFGRDSVIPVYVERYDTLQAPLRLEVRNERGHLLWSDTVSVPSRGAISSGVVEVPVSRVGIGMAHLSLLSGDSVSTASAGVFVGFGEDLPVATFENMVSYLRYFAAPYRLQKLRDAPEERRPEEWATFLRETDSQPNTALHEDLRLYFSRLVRANGRFRDESTLGWQSDRGRVFISLGEPDQILEPTLQDFSRNRQQIWEYRSIGVQLVFIDQTGMGRWRLAPSSNTLFETEFRRRLK